QSAEAPLFHLAVAVGVLAGLLDRLAGDSDRALAAAVLTLRIVEDALVLGVVADQAVALARDPVLDLARRRELEAFLDAALGLELGHFRLLTFSNGRGSPFGRARSVDSRGLEEGGPIEGDRREGNLPGQLRAVAAEETAGVVDAQPIDQRAHVAYALLRGDLSARSAHAGLDPAGAEHDRGHAPGFCFQRKTTPRHVQGGFRGAIRDPAAAIVADASHAAGDGDRLAAAPHLWKQRGGELVG